MSSFLDSLPQSSSHDRLSIVLSDTGEWEYANTGVSAVGARDITLGEVVDPLIVARSGQQPEGVLLPLSAIIEQPRLNWVLQAGTRLESEGETREETRFMVPWAIWQEHAAEPVDAWLPERDASGLDRSLAIAEREFRFAKRALDDAGLARHRTVVLAGQLGYSRRKVGEPMGISAGRVQQLSEDPPAEVLGAVEEFVEAAGRVASLFGEGPCPREDIQRPPDMGSDQFDEVMASMLDFGLLEEVSAGLQLTADGRALSADEGQSVDRATGRNRKRAHNASR